MNETTRLRLTFHATYPHAKDKTKRHYFFGSAILPIPAHALLATHLEMMIEVFGSPRGISHHKLLIPLKKVVFDLAYDLHETQAICEFDNFADGDVLFKGMKKDARFHQVEKWKSDRIKFAKRDFGENTM